ncbi:hypothetical protein L4X63_01045 [Geomonas sp. Red32]|nr:hypothetical protein [Geomonas sp. Red32]
MKVDTGMIGRLMVVAVAGHLLASVALAADDPARLLPKPACGAGWSLEGRPAVYGRETLSDRIDGEAEIFFPYGFEFLSYGRYVNKEQGFDVDVYRMGSALDAFGMFSGYRPEGAETVKTGSDGAVTESQLFFYQDRYFVRLQSTGTPETGKGPLEACAREVSRLLPPATGAPKETKLLDLPEVVKGSVQYKATSLLGYDFFPRGLVADVMVGGEPARVYIVLTDSVTDAVAAFGNYRAYLRNSGSMVLYGEDRFGATLTGTDPLYGNMLAEQRGPYVFGLVRLNKTAAGFPLMGKIRARLVR